MLRFVVQGIDYVRVEGGAYLTADADLSININISAKHLGVVGVEGRKGLWIFRQLYAACIRPSRCKDLS